MRIGIISDTHGFIDDKILKHFDGCEQIWHAGDIGDNRVIDKLESICEVKAVYGNIDDSKTRIRFPENQCFTTEESKILLTHIAGYPGTYNPRVRALIRDEKPDFVVCGHSHILKIIYDRKLNHLHINPGAAGISGFHKVRTLVRFNLEGGKASKMEVVEMPRRLS